MPGNDLILTAANRSQARAYLRQLNERLREDLLEDVERVLVSPDPGGVRVGSGTATLVALFALVARIRRERRQPALSISDALAERRVIIIHSGGDSRRLVAYAAQGKIFAPLLDSNQPFQNRTLFDAIFEDVRSIEFPRNGGVLVASGDVLLGVAQLALRFDERSVTAVAWPDSIARASRHGAFVLDAVGCVRDVLQKPDEATLRSRDAIDDRGRVAIDLGLLMVPAAIAAEWVERTVEAGVWPSPQPPLVDLYADMLPALVKPIQRDDDRAQRLLDALGGSGLHAEVVSDVRFLHIGSTCELLDHALAAAANHGADDGACINASIVAGDSMIRRSFIDSCRLSMPARLPGENMVVGVPAECAANIELPRGKGLVCLPIDANRWSAIGFDIDDDFKTRFTSAAGQAGAAALNAASWRAGDDRTLWSARLWRIGSASEAVAHALGVLRGEAPIAFDDLHSPATLMERVNHRRLLQQRDDAARACAFAAVAATVRSAGMPLTRDMPTWPAIGATVAASAPVRIDLAGGWSDTPPICHDVGGCVVNVAVRLNAARPIRARAMIIADPVIRIRSVDLQREAVFARSAEILAHGDPSDWAALPKAALALTGFAPADPSIELARWLSERGGGVELTIASDLPKGSGLGASSILGAATLACLARLAGAPLTRDQLIVRTSALEQMMSTAGGWQDQAGGVSGGAKFLTTPAGRTQVPHETPLLIPPDFWRERVLLYCTGWQRLARDILQQVVWRWIRGGRAVRNIVARLRDGARRMREDLAGGDMDGFARCMLEFWELKKAIDPGATTPAVEALIERVKPHLDAWELPGAGGGGFLFMIARDALAAQRVRSMLRAQPTHPSVGFFDAQIDHKGLVVAADSAGADAGG